MKLEFGQADVFVIVITHILMVTMNLKTWEVNITLFSLKIPVISEMKTNVIWKEADIFSIVHIYWVVNYTFFLRRF